MEIIKGTKQELGECNFHSNNEKYYVVYEMRGKSITVRICAKCLKEAKEGYYEQ